MADPESLPAVGTPTENGIQSDQLQPRPHPPPPQVQPVPTTQQSAPLQPPVPTPPPQQSTRLQPPVPTPPPQQSATLQPPVQVPVPVTTPTPTPPHSQISPQQAPTLSSVTPAPVAPKPKRARKQTGANNKTNPIAKPEPKRKTLQKRSQPPQPQIQPVPQAQQSATLQPPVPLPLPIPAPANQQSTRLQPPLSKLLTQQSSTLQLPLTTPPLLQSTVLQPPVPTPTPPHSQISPLQVSTLSSATASPAEPKPKRARKQTGANNKTNTITKSEPKRKTKDTPPKAPALVAAPLTQQLDPISPAVFASAFEELRDNVWSQVSRYVIELAQHFDIPSLIGTLYTLRQENDKLVNKVRDLTTKRDQLIAMNARLDLPGPMLTQHLSHTSPNFSSMVASLTSSQKPAGPLMAHGANNCSAHNSMFK